MCGSGTTIRDKREVPAVTDVAGEARSGSYTYELDRATGEATGTQYVHPTTRFPSIILIGGQSIILTTLREDFHSHFIEKISEKLADAVPDH
jgi:hypothetical protein